MDQTYHDLLELLKQYAVEYIDNVKQMPVFPSNSCLNILL